MCRIYMQLQLLDVYLCIRIDGDCIYATSFRAACKTVAWNCICKRQLKAKHIHGQGIKLICCCSHHCSSLLTSSKKVNNHACAD